MYTRKNLEIAWEKVRRNRGTGGVDGKDLESFKELLEANLERLHQELKDDAYTPQSVQQNIIPKAGSHLCSNVRDIPTTLVKASGATVHFRRCKYGTEGFSGDCFMSESACAGGS